MQIALIIFGLALGFLAYRHWSKRRTRARLLSASLTVGQREIIADEVPLVRKLPADLRRRHEGKINLFLAQINFVGCGGLEVTDRMRLSIAAQACLLIANSDAWYDHLSTVLIYPGAFKSKEMTSDGYVVSEQEVVRIGESWLRGPVVLSWRHTEEGASDDADGRNVVLHEFAHQLDDLSGETDGAPVLNDGQSLAAWEDVFVGAFERHLGKVEDGDPTVPDPYGAHSVEEYFAVAIEAFFERPSDLKEAEPMVYKQLAQLLNLDPAAWR